VSFGLFNNYLEYGFIGLIVIVIFFVFLFFLIREITLWYFRINKNTETLESISLSLEKIVVIMDFLAKDINYKNQQEEEENEAIAGDTSKEEVAPGEAE
jgi:uncharacterized membrane protein